MIVCEFCYHYARYREWDEEFDEYIYYCDCCVETKVASVCEGRGMTQQVIITL